MNFFRRIHSGHVVVAVLRALVCTVPVFGAVACSVVWAAEPSGRPNVLFIAVDDLRPELHCYGMTDMHTPNIDRLAASGVLFERHYVQFAVCIPSRVALLTSLRSERTHQVYGPPVWEKIQGAQPLGKTFGAAGYATVSLGKVWHVEGPVSDTFDVKWTPPAGTGDYADAKNMALLLRALNAKKPKKGAVAAAAGRQRLPPIAECADVPDNAYRDGMICDRAISEIRRLKDGRKPFLLAVGFHKPHIPFVAPKCYWDLYDPAKLKLAPNPRFPQDMPRIAFSGNPNFHNYDYDPFEPLPTNGDQVMPEATARHVRHAYFAAVSFADAQVGRVLDELKRNGLEDNTIVVLWGDHGYHLGDTGMWGKQTNFESATRSPLIVRVPGRSPAGARCNGLVETVDIFPTLLELCGLSPLPLSDGHSFAPLLSDPTKPWKQAVFHVFDRHTQVDGHYQLIIGHAVRTATNRLVSWQVGWDLSGKRIAEELYDYVHDPYETRNLAHDPASADLLHRMEQTLRNGPAQALPNQALHPLPPIPSVKALAQQLPCTVDFFDVDGHHAFLIRPKDKVSASPMPWVWYAPVIGNPNSDHTWMFKQWLEKGIGMAGVEVGESYGSPQGRKVYAALWRTLTSRYQMSSKPCLLPQSRGGLMLYNWAAENPARVACIAGIYPVCDLRSYPGLERACSAYGLSAAELEARLAEHNPIDRLAPLAKAGVPILHVHGAADKVVPLEKNSAELARRYRALGGQAQLIVVPGKGHQVCDEFFHCRKLVDFVVANASTSPRDK